MAAFLSSRLKCAIHPLTRFFPSGNFRSAKLHYAADGRVSDCRVHRVAAAGLPSRHHSYWHGASSRPLLGCTTYDVLRATSNSKADEPAIVSCHQNIHKTYRQFIEDVDRLAGGLVSLGYPIGTMAGIMSANVYEWVVLQFAIAKLGWILVNINPAYQIPELEYVLNLVQCKVLIIGEREHNMQDFHDMVSQLVPGIQEMIPTQLKSERLPHLRIVINLGPDRKNGCVLYGDLVEACTPSLSRTADEINAKLDVDAFTNVQFTSGTTGKPKAVPLTHHNTVNNARTIGEWSGVAEDPTAAVCLNVPLMHCFGCIIGSLSSVIHGAKLVMPAPRFNAVAALDAIKTHKCTMLLGTPTMYVDLLSNIDATSHDLTSLHSGIMSGAPCLLALREKVIRQMKLETLHVAYGATEMSPVVSFTQAEILKSRPESVGIAIDHVEVKIVDKANQIVPFGTRGELCSRGYHIFQGYLHEPGRTAEVIKNGWYYSGDEAVMSSDGVLTITGRVRDMIIRGGENIYPAEIENVLMEMPK
ncbi:acyl-CoA synthetase family member 2, partial [Tropilaelaps mercedesae]